MRTPADARTLVALALAAAGLAGCSRENFRARADKDVEAVISQKNIFPDWKVENWHVYPDTRARFADPSRPDFPPYPPDDYAAWLASPNPQHPGRGGVGRFEGDGYLRLIADWDCQNRAEDAARIAAERVKDYGSKAPAKAPDTSQTREADRPDNPLAGEEFYAVGGGALGYARALASDVQPFRLRVDQTVELALFNAREFQDRREDLYLAALPVTLERYNFAAQAFATEQLVRDTLRRDYPGGESRAWNINTTAGFNRTFATGASLLVRLANQIVVDLSGPSPQTSISNLGLTFIQPLLRGSGYAVTLESLTQAERSLMYAIRSYARFRKIFYVAIVGTGNYTNNPYGLQGLSTNLGRGVGANLTASPNGYLPTLLRGTALANERKNVAALEQFLRLFQNLKEGGAVTELQVTQVEQTLLRSRANVLTFSRQYLDNLDLFKLQLGVPATLPIELDDAPLRPVRRQMQRFEQVYDQLREVERRAGQFTPGEPAAAYRQRWAELLTQSSLARGTPFAEQYPRTARDLATATDDALATRVAELFEQRRKFLDGRAERQLKNVPDTAAQVAELDALDGRIDWLRFEQYLRRYESRPWLAAPADRQAADQATAFRAVFEAGMLLAIQPRNQRLVGIRADWPDLPPVCVAGTDLLKIPLDDAYTQVAQVALVQRLDLMNARAQVVDAWRQITVQANALQGAFDVRYDLDAQSPLDEAAGLGFASTRTRHTLTLRYDPPLVRRAERNSYRAALVAYQRQRRNLMAFEDNILTDTRTDLRQLRALSEQYVLQQRAMELAYSQVDNARSTFVAPPDPAARDTAGGVAALTQQLLTAQSSLLSAQNDLFTTWLTYQSIRLELFLDLENLPLDARGLLSDEPLLSVPPRGPADAPAEPERLPAPRPEPAAERLPEPRREP